MRLLEGIFGNDIDSVGPGGRELNLAESIGLIERQGFVWLGWQVLSVKKRGRPPKVKLSRYERSAFVRQLNAHRWHHKFLVLPSLRKGKGHVNKREEIKQLFRDLLQINHKFLLKFNKSKIPIHKLVYEVSKRLEREGKACFSESTMRRILNEVLAECPHIYRK